MHPPGISSQAGSASATAALAPSIPANSTFFSAISVGRRFTLSFRFQALQSALWYPISFRCISSKSSFLSTPSSLISLYTERPASGQLFSNPASAEPPVEGLATGSISVRRPSRCAVLSKYLPALLLLMLCRLFGMSRWKLRFRFSRKIRLRECCVGSPKSNSFEFPCRVRLICRLMEHRHRLQTVRHWAAVPLGKIVTKCKPSATGMPGGDKVVLPENASVLRGEDVHPSPSLSQRALLVECTPLHPPNTWHCWQERYMPLIFPDGRNSGTYYWRPVLGCVWFLLAWTVSIAISCLAICFCARRSLSAKKKGPDAHNPGFWRLECSLTTLTTCPPCQKALSTKMNALTSLRSDYIECLF